MRFLLIPLLALAANGADYQLKATPGTVAWGYYWSAAKPVLRIKSGDRVEIQTMLTNSPERLAAAGVKDEEIEAELKAIYRGGEGQGSGRAHPDGADFRGRRRTGRHAGGANSQYQILHSVRLQQFPADQRRLDGGGFSQGRDQDYSAGYQTRRGEVFRSHRNSLAALFRQHGSCAAGSRGPRVERAAGNARGESGQQGPGGGYDAVHPGTYGGRAVRSRRRPCGAGKRRGGHHGARDFAGGHVRVRACARICT